MPAPGVVAVFLADAVLVSLTAFCVWTALIDLIAVRTRAFFVDPVTMLETEWRRVDRQDGGRIPEKRAMCRFYPG